MQLSARNQLKGVVKDITLGNIMAEVVIQLPDGQEVVALITYTSSERLNLQIGDQVTAIFKSTEVMVGKEG
jgi:molybdopterin-binding protein